jgi:hypothetical protein
MSSLVISGDTSGTVTLAAPAVAGSNTLSLQAATATMSVNTLATAVASTSGTSIDYTGLPSWVKKITVMFNGVSLSGSSHPLIQVGSGSVLSSGYTSTGNTITRSNTTGGASSTAGFFIAVGAAAYAFSGHMVLTLVSGSIWVSSHSGLNSTTNVCCGGGNVSIGGTLDRIRITTVNGTDTFDAGSVNILYEG